MTTKIKSGSVAPAQHKTAMKSGNVHCEVLTSSVPFPLASLLVVVLYFRDIYIK